MTSTDHEPDGGRHHYTDAELHNPDVAHEEADVNIRTVLTFAVGLAIVVMISAGLMGIMFRVLSNQAAGLLEQVPGGRDEKSGKLRLGGRDRRRGTRADRGSEEAADQAWIAGSRERRR